MLGWVLTCVASGMEAAAHIAEDTKSPARTVPLSMFWSVAATYIMGWIVSRFGRLFRSIVSLNSRFLTVHLRAASRSLPLSSRM